VSVSTSNWRIWPVIAAVLVILFISWDISLLGRVRSLQDRIGRQVDLLHELSDLSAGLNQLSLVHRVDLNTGQQGWNKEFAAVRQRLQHTHTRYANEPGAQHLPELLGPVLHACDSLHHEVLARKASPADVRLSEAVFQMMVQRAQKHVDQGQRRVHEQGLSGHTKALSARWDEAQGLLFLACAFAVVFALLVGMARRLLVDSRLRAEQIHEAKRNLEHAHRELRETMLSKEEKEVMIKEIHHRVKNNLQIVKSLIRFQTDQVDDPRVKELFNECINRVGAMALVHEQTYLSKDLSNIDVKTYLESLVRDLIHAYAVGIRLKQDIRIDVKTLGVDTLVPLGLLINEVISNSFKYAFKGRSEGTITVHLTGSEEGGLHLRIGDDGPGMPSREKWDRPNSLGIELIHTLAGQLDARIDLMPVPGTHYELRSTRLDQRKVA
jgi:two-component sensor histidine kinase